MKRLSIETIASIQELYEKGLSKYAIAKELGISIGSVSYHLAKRNPALEVDDMDRLIQQNRLLKELIRVMIN